MLITEWCRAMKPGDMLINLFLQSEMCNNLLQRI